MADTEVVTKQPAVAGYTDINFECLDAKVFVGKDLDDALAFRLALGLAGKSIARRGQVAEERHDEIAYTMRASWLSISDRKA